MDGKMDWAGAIKRHSEALAEIVADLFAMLGFAAGTEMASRLPWPTYRAVLRVLKPAESAVRRLIVVAARGLVVKPAVSRPKSVSAIKSRKALHRRSPSFQLFDPHPRIMIPRLRRKPKRPVGRIHMFNADGELVTIWPPPQPKTTAPPSPPKSADGMVSARRLIRRLEALEAALADVPRQALRLARWRMREEKSPDPSFKSPIRPGRAPGSRRKPTHEIDELLSECQWLAHRAEMHDTS